MKNHFKKIIFITLLVGGVVNNSYALNSCLQLIKYNKWLGTVNFTQTPPGWFSGDLTLNFTSFSDPAPDGHVEMSGDIMLSGEPDPYYWNIQKGSVTAECIPCDNLGCVTLKNVVTTISGTSITQNGAILNGDMVLQGDITSPSHFHAG